MDGYEYIPELDAWALPHLARAFRAAPVQLAQRWAIKPPMGLIRRSQATVDAPPANPRQGRRCLNLLNRTEFRHGCNGWMCEHNCKLGLPAVPGAYCQTCEPHWVDDGPF